jgi:hypothetical protein
MSNQKTNFHYLTGIDTEIKELFNNKSEDNLKQWIDTEIIKKYIDPDPSI